jgi:hypothetical protein
LDRRQQEPRHQPKEVGADSSSLETYLLGGFSCL